MNDKELHERCNWNGEKREWACKKCGSIIMGKVQYQSGRVPGFTCAGGGDDVRRVTIPYCPKCDAEPSDTGEYPLPW